MPWLKLLRAGTLFSPAADILAGACIVGATWNAQGLDLARAMVASVLIYAAGMVLNDHADRKEDAKLRPERPIPSGQITPRNALALGMVLLLGGVGIAPETTWIHHGILAGLVLVYDYLAKANVLAACTNMGVLRALNLWTGMLFLTGDATPALVLDQRVAAGAYGIYIFTVTLLASYEDDPRVRPKAIVSLLAIPPLVTLAALVSIQDGNPIVVVAAIGLVFAFGRRNRAVELWTPVTIRGAVVWLLVGTMLYTGLLCAARERWFEAVGILATALLARRISRRIAMG